MDNAGGTQRPVIETGNFDGCREIVTEADGSAAGEAGDVHISTPAR